MRRRRIGVPVAPDVAGQVEGGTTWQMAQRVPLTAERVVRRASTTAAPTVGRTVVRRVLPTVVRAVPRASTTAGRTAAPTVVRRVLPTAEPVARRASTTVGLTVGPTAAPE